jgi:hypothetical protein
MRIPLADLIVVRPSYTRFCLDIHEVKSTRSDFLSDIRSNKWRKYLPHCHRFYFATLPGVCKKIEIPSEAGWMVRGDRGWSGCKMAPRREISINIDMLLAMLFYKNKVSHHREYLAHYGLGYNETNKILKKAGQEMSAFIAWQRGKT